MSLSSAWRTADASAFLEALRLYPARLGRLNNPELAALDRWYLCDLPKSVFARDPPHLTRDDLSKVMAWKLKKGKFRPRLQQFVDAADPETVVSATTDALEHAKAGNVRRAIDALTVLKGVGPATATAVLAACVPTIPFMSDEALMAALGSRPYTVSGALELGAALTSKAAELTKLAAVGVASEAPATGAKTSRKRAKTSTSSTPSSRGGVPGAGGVGGADENGGVSEGGGRGGGGGASGGAPGDESGAAEETVTGLEAVAAATDVACLDSLPLEVLSWGILTPCRWTPQLLQLALWSDAAQHMKPKATPARGKATSKGGTKRGREH